MCMCDLVVIYVLFFFSFFDYRYVMKVIKTPARCSFYFGVCLSTAVLMCTTSSSVHACYDQRAGLMYIYVLLCLVVRTLTSVMSSRHRERDAVSWKKITK